MFAQAFQEKVSIAGYRSSPLTSRLLLFKTVQKLSQSDVFEASVDIMEQLKQGECIETPWITRCLGMVHITLAALVQPGVV